jgi:peptidoglycan-associated lipoprotein
MKRQCIYLIAVLTAISLVVGCAGTKEVKPIMKPAEEAVKPVPPAEKKIEEEMITAKKPGEVRETEIEEAMQQKPVEEVSSLNDIYFAFDDYELSAAAQTILQKNASWIKNNPRAKVQIEGHCDERGTNEYNMALGERRANSAKKYLIKLGIKEAQLSTISYGEEKPLDPGHTEDAWAKNRRDHLKILK